MKLEKEAIIDLIKSRFVGKNMKEIQFEVAQILNISSATTYNKLSGRNDFSVVEFLALAKTLGISLDSFLADSKKTKSEPIFFYADGLEEKPNTFYEYFIKILDNVQKADLGSEETKATFICLQPHVFHLMPYPFLLYLKMYTYNLINWKISNNDVYDPISFIQDKKMQDLISKLSEAYESIPVTEMVGHNFVHPICSQLDYLVKSRIIKNLDQLKQIKVDMFNFLTDLEMTASKGSRTGKSGKEVSVDMYINKFIHVSNIILIETKSSGLFTIQSDVPDVVKTDDPVYIHHFKQWLESNKEYTLAISKTGGMERKDFFDRNRHHIEMVMTNLENIIKQNAQ